MNLPNQKHPCKNCPFRKDTLKGWLNKSIEEIIGAESFVCHKQTKLQCAGHMILNGTNNKFVAMAMALGIDTKLKGRDIVFESKQDCINHHKQNQ